MDDGMNDSNENSERTSESTDSGCIAEGIPSIQISIGVQRMAIPFIVKRLLL